MSAGYGVKGVRRVVCKGVVKKNVSALRARRTIKIILNTPLPKVYLPPEAANRMADIRRISVTSRMGSENFAKHIRENNCIY